MSCCLQGKLTNLNFTWPEKFLKDGKILLPPRKSYLLASSWRMPPFDSEAGTLEAPREGTLEINWLLSSLHGLRGLWKHTQGNFRAPQQPCGHMESSPMILHGQWGSIPAGAVGIHPLSWHSPATSLPIPSRIFGWPKLFQTYFLLSSAPWQESRTSSRAVGEILSPFEGPGAPEDEHKAPGCAFGSSFLRQGQECVKLGSW